MPKRAAKRKAINNYGKVKALLVGINYRGTNNELGGCINDVLNTKQRILAEYPAAQIELLTDDTALQPTREVILEKLNSLVASAEPGDTLMFHYSGHGSQAPDYHGDEEDGQEETICPLDFRNPRVMMVNGRAIQTDNQIIDDEIHEIICNIPQEVKFLMLSDSCHSGTIADLKYDFAHYQGPSVWSDEAESVQPFQQETAVTNMTVKSLARWNLTKFSKEIWITPLNFDVNQRIGSLRVNINDNNEVPTALLINSNMDCDALFEEIDQNKYKVTSPKFPDMVFIATPLTLGSKKHIARSSVIERQLSSAAAAYVNYSYDYNPETGKHTHSFDAKKRTLKMKAPTCKGGELRVISGCEENQTSADTGRNGACSKAFWETVQSLGGLYNFFPKVFSHNINDLREIQDRINANLSRLGFTQHSIISWDHAHRVHQHQAGSSRALMIAEPAIGEENNLYRTRLRSYRPYSLF